MQETNKSVTGYLASLVWDGTPRIDRWLVDLAGAEDSPYVRAVSRLMLVAAVRRARIPGSRSEHLPVIEGPQGSGKSRALRVLAVEDAWFCADCVLESDTRRLIESTAGKWIVQVSELMALGRPEAVALKVFLSRTHDEGRLTHARDISRVPRQFAVVGTADEEIYLAGATGHRRILPVRIQRFDLERLRGVRDQLWAEAAAVEATGESIQLDPRLSRATS